MSSVNPAASAGMQLACRLIMSAIERDRITTVGELEDKSDDRARATDGGRLLLLVDDDEDLRLLLGDSLRAAGYQTIEARDGADALAMLRGSIQLPVAIITDLSMPRLDGWSFIEAVRADGGFVAIPIVVVSASACPPPGICCLGKPLTPDQLIVALTRLGAPPPQAGPPAGHRCRSRAAR